MLDDEQPQEYLGRGRMPSMHRGEAIALREIAVDVLVEQVVVEQVVQFHEHGVGLIGDPARPQ
jgi:hypothetical protein